MREIVRRRSSAHRLIRPLRGSHAPCCGAGLQRDQHQRPLPSSGTGRRPFRLVPQSCSPSARRSAPCGQTLPPSLTPSRWDESSRCTPSGAWANFFLRVSTGRNRGGGSVDLGVLRDASPCGGETRGTAVGSRRPGCDLDARRVNQGCGWRLAFSVCLAPSPMDGDSSQGPLGCKAPVEVRSRQHGLLRAATSPNALVLGLGSAVRGGGGGSGGSACLAAACRQLPLCSDEGGPRGRRSSEPPRALCPAEKWPKPPWRPASPSAPHELAGVRTAAAARVPDGVAQ